MLLGLAFLASLWFDAKATNSAAIREAPPSATPAALGASEADAPASKKGKAQLAERLTKLTPEQRQTLDDIVRTIASANHKAAPTMAPLTGEKLTATLDKEHIRAAVAEVKPRIAACYEEALKGDQELAGKLVVQFTIEANDGVGSVAEGIIDDENTTLPPTSVFFQACVLQVVAGAPYPAPEGDGRVNVTYPFMFATKDD